MKNVVGFHHKMKKLFITLEMHTVLSGIIQVGRKPDIFKKNFVVLIFYFFLTQMYCLH